MPSRRLDALVAWLMRPRVRRARRWSFLLTLPASLAVAHLYGVQHGALVLGGRLLFWLLVVAAAWRLGGERGEAVRDLLMHPRIRAFCRAELDVLTALPRLLAVRAGGRAAPGARYDRGTFGAALAFAFTPAVLAEAVALHLLAGGGWIAWVLTAAHGYSLVWLWGFALGPRAYPHRLSARDALFRAGPRYRVRVPRAAVVGAAVRRGRTCTSTTRPRSTSWAATRRCAAARGCASARGARGRLRLHPAGMPHLPSNLSDSEPCTAVLARTDPNEQESVVLLGGDGSRLETDDPGGEQPPG